jgi:hypothetical protein
MPGALGAMERVARGEESGRLSKGHTLPWPFVVWSLPWWYFVFGFGWWRVSARQLTELAPALAAHVSPAATLAVLARTTGLLIETAFYVVFWRTRGAHLPFWRYAFYLVLGSLADLEALDLAALSRAGGPRHAWIVALVGPGATSPSFAHHHPIVTGAFAGFGIITFGRWCWTAWAQSIATRRPFVSPVLLTASLWLATHLAAAAALALARGRSVVP